MGFVPVLSSGPVCSPGGTMQSIWLYLTRAVGDSLHFSWFPGSWKILLEAQQVHSFQDFQAADEFPKCCFARLQHNEQRVCNTGFWFSQGFVGHERRFPAIAGGDIRYIDGTCRQVSESSFVRVFLIYINQLASTCQRSTYHRLALGRKSRIIPTTSFCCWFAEHISSWVAGFP